jgi:hypothetical protein
VSVGDDVALGPAPGREVFPGTMEHPVRVDDRLGLQARIQRLTVGGPYHVLPNSLARFDRLTDQRVVFGVDTVAAHRVVTVGTARLDLAIGRDPAYVNGFLDGGRFRPCLDPALGEQLRIQRVAYAAVDLLYVALADVRDHVVSGVVAPVLPHRRLDRVLDSGQPLV